MISQGSALAILIASLLVTYVYFAFALQAIARKTSTSRSWMAWVPIASVYLMVKIAKAPWWSFFLFLLLVWVSYYYIGTVAGVLLTAWWGYKIAEIRGRPGWFGLLLAVPLLNFIVIGVLAWSD